MRFEVRIHELAEQELAAIRKFERKVIMDAMLEHLATTPDLPSRRRKMLVSAAPSFEHESPIWQLRAGDWRVFYDVDVSAGVVHVRAVRQKGRKRTEEVM